MGVLSVCHIPRVILIISELFMIEERIQWVTTLAFKKITLEIPSGQWNLVVFSNWFISTLQDQIANILKEMKFHLNWIPNIVWDLIVLWLPWFAFLIYFKRTCILRFPSSFKLISVTNLENTTQLHIYSPARLKLVSNKHFKFSAAEPSVYLLV